VFPEFVKSRQRDRERGKEERGKEGKEKREHSDGFGTKAKLRLVLVVLPSE
jgi:hypothetical protein